MTLTLAGKLDAPSCLPQGGGTLIGRAWAPGEIGGPSVVSVRGGDLYDIGALAPTSSDLLNMEDAAAKVAAFEGVRLGTVADILANSAFDARDPAKPYLLSPIDLQAVKAAGVTFVASMLERVIEEQAKGDPSAALSIRQTINAEIGADIAFIVPGSAEAGKLKQALIDRGLWSQYLEVGIGPYAEVFTKAQPMSTVGTGAEVGLHPDSTWNNPEPEVVLIVNNRGELIGATLGNDVNLRDFEGRSALLLGRAKDNNASCALGPFLRLFDDGFGIDDLRACEVSLKVEGEDGYVLEDSSSMSRISRDVLDLVKQTISRNHQYPDGLVLFTGTMFAPTDDRDAPGMGFTHKRGDIVTISAPELGSLTNRVTLSTEAAPWTFGAGELMRNLAARNLL